MFTTKVSADNKDELINKSKEQRLQRTKEKQYSSSVVLIQKHIRRFLSNRSLKKRIISEVETVLSSDDYSAQSLYSAIQRMLFFPYKPDDTSVLCKACQKVLASMSCNSKDKWYVGLSITKISRDWLTQVQKMLTRCIEDISCLNLLKPVDKAKLLNYFQLFQIMCDATSWKLLKACKTNQLLIDVLIKMSGNIQSCLITNGVFTSCQAILVKNVARTEPALGPQHFFYFSKFIIHAMETSHFNEDIWCAVFLTIFATPSLIKRFSNEELATLSKGVNILNALSSFNINSSIIIRSLTTEQLMFLFLNIIELLHVSLKNGETINYPGIVDTLYRYLSAISPTVDNGSSKKTNHWHPLLGWYDKPVSPELSNSIKLIALQIHLLHSANIKKFFFQDLFDAEFPEERGTTWKMLFSLPIKIQSDSKLLIYISKVCKIYNLAVKTFYLFKSHFLMSICCYPDFLSCLWKLVYSEHSQSCRSLAKSIVTENTADPMVPLLLMFCNCFGQYFVVLDDQEIYETEKPFTLKELNDMAELINSVVFNIIWNNFEDMKTPVVAERVTVCHGLLILLHERDERRKFTVAKHWTPKDASPSQILTELKGLKGRAQKIADIVPWVLPHKKKLEYLQEVIKADKSLGRQRNGELHSRTILVKIHRSRIFEDGFQQLKDLKNIHIKHHIKILFVNELGLDEAGIDQDGVFKEFLEETIKHAFDPSFSLFAVTEENHWLYPSPLSKIHSEHLHLFNYIGKMLAKALYEGITLDTQFAPFFTRQLLSNKNPLYSYLDELPSLDAELFKQLQFVKHYDGDIEDLGLTFSVDENEFGKIVTHELMPGSSCTSVTNQNKVSYVHHMAHYKMYTQIRAQIQAFVKGFKSIIDEDWLRMFSLPELQKLISGDSAEIDLGELKKCVR